MFLPHRLRLLFVLFAVAAAALPVAAHPGASIAVAGDGRVYFVDTGGGVFSIGPDGRIARQEGPAFHWFAFDPRSRFRATPWPSIPGAEFRSAGVNPTLVLSSDFPVTISGDRFYFPERAGERVRIVAIDSSGSRSVRALLPPVVRRGKVVQWLNGLAPGSDGTLYYTEDRAVKKIDAAGRVSVVAAQVSVPNCSRVPGSREVDLPYLRGLAEAGGALYVAAAGCGALLKVDARGGISVILRAEPPWSPTAVAIANGEVYVLEYTHTDSDDRTEWVPRVRKISRDGKVTNLGGTNARSVR